MASINLGRVGFVLRGTWISGTTYSPLDVVLYNGASYAAKTTNSNLAPSSASAAWQELTQISSAVASGIAASAVRYDTGQNLSGSQKSTARGNIDAASVAFVESVQSSVSSLSSRVVIAEGNVSALNTRVGTAEGNITALQTALNNKITVSGTTLVIA